MSLSCQTMLHMVVYGYILSNAFLWLSSASPTKGTASASSFYNDDTREDLEAQLRHLRQKLSECGCSRMSQNDMKLRYVRNVEVTCNDRSKAGYHIRKSQGSRRWVIYLEGGAFCYDNSSCDERTKVGPWSHVSSRGWPVTKRGTGILSGNIEDNPSWWNANAVSVPYCSSDVWSGNQTLAEARNRTYVFMGARIVQEVIHELLDLHDLGNATQILLAGSSVGGTGVMLNLDRVADFVKKMGSQAGVYGLSDSGWYIDHTPRAKNLCNGKRKRCSASKTIQTGQRYWNGIVPDNCAKEFTTKPWNCYFGDVLYKFIRRPLFISQYLYDEEQLKLAHLEIPHNNSDYERILKIGKQIRRSLKDTRNLFAPACLAHELISKREWKLYTIDGFTLPDALDCWLPKPYKATDPRCQNKLIDNCTYPSCNVQCPDVITQYGSERPTVYDMTKRYNHYKRYLASKGEGGAGTSRSNDVQYDSATHVRSTSTGKRKT